MVVHILPVEYYRPFMGLLMHTADSSNENVIILMVFWKTFFFPVYKTKYYKFMSHNYIVSFIELLFCFKVVHFVFYIFFCNFCIHLAIFFLWCLYIYIYIHLVVNFLQTLWTFCYIFLYYTIWLYKNLFLKCCFFFPLLLFLQSVHFILV